MKEFNWKPDASPTNVNLHLETLRAAVAYYKTRRKTSKVRELEEEINSLKKFYNI